MKDREDIIVKRLMVIGLCLVVAWLIFWAYLFIDMWHDHECYIDGHYNTPQCQKYIREDR